MSIDHFNFNTSIVGTFAQYAYLAGTDAAGNTGKIVTRSVIVLDYEPINVNGLIASSDNSVNGSYAKVGDEIKLTLTADAPIETVMGTILGDDNFTVSQSRGDVIIRKTITQNDINGNLTFDIFVSNSSGYAARVTQDNLTSSDIIIIDTIPPIITLKGTNDTVSVLNRAYTDLNATAYDLSYGSKNIPPTGTVDINNEGNYTLTYSAPSDLAGNEAQNITRNVQVLDLPPISLVENSTVSPKFSSNNLNTSYAKAGNRLTLEFTVNDTIVSSTTQFTNPDRTPSVTINDATYTATLTVPSTLIESYADFVITVENNQSVILSVTENDFPSVFIDTIALQ